MQKVCFFRLAPSFIQGCGKNSLNACGKQEKSSRKKISELQQEFDKFLAQASTFFSILEFFYECRYIFNRVKILFVDFPKTLFLFCTEKSCSHKCATLFTFQQNKIELYGNHFLALHTCVIAIHNNFKKLKIVSDRLFNNCLIRHTIVFL